MQEEDWDVFCSVTLTEILIYQVRFRFRLGLVARYSRSGLIRIAVGGIAMISRCRPIHYTILARSCKRILLFSII